VKSLTDAGKKKQGPAEALTLANSVSRIVVAKGKKIVSFDMKNNRPADEVLLARLLGPTGNLRAPTMRIGQSLFVGFNEEALQTFLT
jgi:hypothetical protein